MKETHRISPHIQIRTCALTPTLTLIRQRASVSNNTHRAHTEIETSKRTEHVLARDWGGDGRARERLERARPRRLARLRLRGPDRRRFGIQGSDTDISVVADVGVDGGERGCWRCARWWAVVVEREEGRLVWMLLVLHFGGWRRRDGGAGI